MLLFLNALWYKNIKKPIKVTQVKNYVMIAIDTGYYVNTPEEKYQSICISVGVSSFIVGLF